MTTRWLPAPSRWRLIAAALLVLVSSFSRPASAESKILQNDSFSGTATFTQLAAFGEQDVAAAVFLADPADYPYRIEKIQALVLAPLTGTIALVSVTIWEDLGTLEPGPILYSSTYGYQVESSETAMNELDLGCENAIVTVGPVRVGLV